MTSGTVLCILDVLIYLLLTTSWSSSVAQLVEIHLQFRRPWFDSWVGKIPGRRDRLPTPIFLASLVAQTVKNSPDMQEPLVQSLGWKGPLEKGMATSFSILAWRMPWIEEPGRLQSIGLQRVRHN